MSRARRGARKRSAVGTFFFLLGCLALLGATFAAGIAADRWWLHRTATRTPAPAVATREPEKPGARRGAARVEDRTPRDATPVLTFYQDLTAPLTAPPPPARPRVEKEKAAAPDRGADTAPGIDKAPTRYTVQVAAFDLRAQAETLRTNLAAAGLDAYVTENEAAAASRYRVRVGDYANRDAARQAAQRLATERRLSTYVTVR